MTLCSHVYVFPLVNKKDVFCWLQNYATRVTRTRHSSMKYQALMFVLLKYGVPVEQNART